MTCRSSARWGRVLRGAALGLLLEGCFPGPALRYEGARPETRTVLAGSITMGAGHSESTGADSEDASEGDDTAQWGYVAPNATFSAWWRWAMGAHLELSTGTDVDLGTKNAVSGGLGAKLLLTPSEATQRVHLALSASGGLAFMISPGPFLAGWAEVGVPLTIDASSQTSVTLRPQLRYATSVAGGPDPEPYLFTGGSLAVRHPCSKTVDCVYELGVLGLVYPLSDGTTQQGLVDVSFGVGAVF